jgi:5-dehydro-2-deoxygluconokinase
LLFELLVPPEPHQVEAMGGDEERWDSEARPRLMEQAIAELQDAGVEPDIWKIEGIDRREDCETIAGQTRSGGRDGVACVVLGRGADDAKVDHWLRMGSGVPGYVDGSVAREDATSRISANYRRFIDVYHGAA